MDTRILFESPGRPLSKTEGNGFSLKLVRRMQIIEALPPSQQKFLLRTIDTFLKGAEK
jgi:hypothetical protein